MFRVALENLVEAVSAQHGPKWKSEGVDRAMYFCNLALELSFRVALENLVGTVWAQQVPK